MAERLNGTQLDRAASNTSRTRSHSRHFTTGRTRRAVLQSSLALAAASGLGHGAFARGMQDQFRRSALRVDGPELVNAAGETVRLQGINLGGWLVTEAWMCGFTDSADTRVQAGPLGVEGRSTVQSLEARFGAERAARLMRAWRANWMTSHDLDQIRSWGFNLVRAPISYRTLRDADGRWIRNNAGEIDFSPMDWLVAEAARRGLYTIFVLHVWPDQREQYDRIARPEGRPILDAMTELWTAVAERYRGNGAVAGFDIINEFPGNWGVHKALAKAIRDADPDRVLIFEGYTFDEFAERHANGVITNSVYSDHIYRADPVSQDDIVATVKGYESRAFPVYVGEFLAADFHAATAVMDAAGLSWSPWTYKTVDMGDWGAVNYHSELRVDIQNDTYETLLDTWSEALSTWTRPWEARNVWLNEGRIPTNLTGNTGPLQ